MPPNTKTPIARQLFVRAEMLLVSPFTRLKAAAFRWTFYAQGYESLVGVHSATVRNPFSLDDADGASFDGGTVRLDLRGESAMTASQIPTQFAEVAGRTDLYVAEAALLPGTAYFRGTVVRTEVQHTYREAPLPPLMATEGVVSNW